MTFSITTQPDTKGQLIVYVRYIHSEKIFRKSTGVKINPTNWDKVKSRLKNISRADQKNIDDQLEQLKAHVNRLNDQNESISVENVKKTFNEMLQKKNDVVVVNLSKSFLDVFKDFKSQKSSELSYRTLLSYDTLYNSLKEYQDNGNELSFEKMDDSFAVSYRDFLLDKGLIDNTIGGRFKTIKTFLRWAIDKGYQVNLKFINFKAEKIEPTKLFLESEELKQLENFTFKDKSLEVVKDMFLFQCNSGLAISDLKRLSKSNIKGNFIKMTRYKTEKEIVIPIHAKLNESLLKYDYSFPKLTDQHYNRMIKKVLEIAGVNSPTEVITKIRGNKEIKTYPKYELLSSHAAVRTFITKASSEIGLDVAEISLITSKTPKVILSSYMGAQIKAAETKMKKW